MYYSVVVEALLFLLAGDVPVVGSITVDIYQEMMHTLDIIDIGLI